MVVVSRDVVLQVFHAEEAFDVLKDDENEESLRAQSLDRTRKERKRERERDMDSKEEECQKRQCTAISTRMCMWEESSFHRDG